MESVRQKPTKGKVLFTLLGVLSLVFLYLPIVVVAIYSLNPDSVNSLVDDPPKIAGRYTVKARPITNFKHGLSPDNCL